MSWTYNVSHHMLLARHCGKYSLKVFALPCAFDATTSPSIGIPKRLAQEIRESYGILFNAWPSIPRHAQYGRFIGLSKFCWCWSCTSTTFRSKTIRARQAEALRVSASKGCRDARSDFDPQLVDLMNNDDSINWTSDMFPSLWPRVVALQTHLETSRPWNFWVLFRDRRDTVQFWTFLYVWNRVENFRS